MSTVAAAIPGIKAIRADEWGGEEAYLWQETGNGALDRVCYVCDSKPTRDALESALQSDLAARRARWAKAGAA